MTWIIISFVDYHIFCGLLFFEGIFLPRTIRDWNILSEEISRLQNKHLFFLPFMMNAGFVFQPI